VKSHNYKHSLTLLKWIVAASAVSALSAVFLWNTNRWVVAGQEARTRRTDNPKPTVTPTPPALGRPVKPLQKPPPTLTTPGGKEVEPDETIRVDTSLVTLNIRVIDRQNRAIGGVRREDFRVYEDGVLQPIEFFSTEEVPISYGLAVDNSGSMRSQLTKVIDTGKTVIKSNKPGDETFLVRFIDSESVETLRDFTADKTLLMDGMESMFIQGGQTAVIDAVYLSAMRVAQYKKGDSLSDRRRRALIVVTDGEDRASFYKPEQLFDRLREEDVQIYVIGFVNELSNNEGHVRKSSRQKAVSLLERLASETGGRAFFPNSLSELPGIAAEITRDLRTQYLIGYNPTNKTQDGTFRSLRVSIVDRAGHDKRIALSRSGYIASRK
jgi:Ca-activated chloride channel homolog